MRGFAFVAIAFVGNASMLSLPFDHYIDSVRKHHPTKQVEQFVRVCGFSTNGKLPIYTLGGDWAISKNLPKDVYDAASDFLTTAEFWKQDSVGSVVNLWTTDAESEQNTMYCFDSNGAIRFIQSIQWSFPSDGYGKWSYGWGYKQKLAFNSNGKLIHKIGIFINRKGNAVAAPKLNKEEREDFDFVPDYKELNFPAALLR